MHVSKVCRPAVVTLSYRIRGPQTSYIVQTVNTSDAILNSINKKLTIIIYVLK